MRTSPTLVAPSAPALLQLAPDTGDPLGSQSYVLRDGAREIRIVIVTSAAAAARAEDPARASPAASTAPPVRLSVDGGTSAGRTEIVINGHRRTLQDCRFVVLLRYIVAHLASAGSWSSREALGMRRSRNVTTYIREAFAGIVPTGFNVIEADRHGRFRLNPALVVEAVAWSALVTHSSPPIRKIAVEQRKRDVRF